MKKVGLVILCGLAIYGIKEKALDPIGESKKNKILNLIGATQNDFDDKSKFLGKSDFYDYAFTAPINYKQINKEVVQKLLEVKKDTTGISQKIIEILN